MEHNISIEKFSSLILLRFKYIFGEMLLHFKDMKELKQFSRELAEEIDKYVEEK